MDLQKSNNFGQTIQSLAKAKPKSDNSEPFGKTVSELAQTKKNDDTNESITNITKKQLNAAILESAVDVSASNSPQVLVLKTALEGINDALKETLGDNAIRNAYDSGLDVSPDATAERIVSLSTAFFGAYQEQHRELDKEAALSSFIDVISSGINTGFSEAKNILSGLGVLEGDVATNIDATYDLVQTKLQAFVDSFAEDSSESSG